MTIFVKDKGLLQTISPAALSQPPFANDLDVAMSEVTVQVPESLLTKSFLPGSALSSGDAAYLCWVRRFEVFTTNSEHVFQSTLDADCGLLLVLTRSLLSTQDLAADKYRGLQLVITVGVAENSILLCQ